MKAKYNQILFITYARTLVFIILFIAFGLNVEKGFFKVLNCILLFLLMVVMWGLFTEWINWIVGGRCDIETYKIYLERRLKSKKDIQTSIYLLDVYILQGSYDKCPELLNKLEPLYLKMSDLQKIEFRLLQIDYMAALNGYDSVKEELKEIDEFLNGIKKVGGNKKKKYQTAINRRMYFSENEWEKAIDVLKKADTSSTLHEVINSYLLGTCYYKMEEYEQAFQSFCFVSKWGGNTKYVALADDIIEKLSDQQEVLPIRDAKKYNIEKFIIWIYFLMALMIIAGIFLVNYYTLYGESTEEIYCRRYLAQKSDVSILYQEDFDNYKMCILSDKGKIGYCLFKKTNNASGIKYKMVDAFCADKELDDHEAELKIIEMLNSESEKDYYQKFHQESEMEEQVWSVIFSFYKENDNAFPEDFTYVGISCYPLISNITIDGKPVEVSKINDEKDENIYLWKIKDIDINYKLRIDYVDE